MNSFDTSIVQNALDAIEKADQDGLFHDESQIVEAQPDDVVEGAQAIMDEQSENALQTPSNPLADLAHQVQVTAQHAHEFLQAAQADDVHDGMPADDHAGDVQDDDVTVVTDHDTSASGD